MNNPMTANELLLYHPEQLLTRAEAYLELAPTFESLKAKAGKYEKVAKTILAQIDDHEPFPDCSCHYLIGDMIKEAL